MPFSRDDARDQGCTPLRRKEKASERERSEA